MITILTRQTGILSWRVFIHEVQSLGTVEGSFSLAIQTGRDFFFADTDLFFSPLANATSSSTKNSSHDRVLFIKQWLHFQYFNFFFKKIRGWERWIVWNGLLYKNKDPFESWRCPTGPGSHDQGSQGPPIPAWSWLRFLPVKRQFFLLWLLSHGSDSDFLQKLETILNVTDAVERELNWLESGPIHLQLDATRWCKDNNEGWTLQWWLKTQHVRSREANVSIYPTFGSLGSRVPTGNWAAMNTMNSP